MSMSVSNPVNLILFVAIAYLLVRLFYPPIPKPYTAKSYEEGEYNWMPETHPDVICFQQFTPSSLSQFDGVKSERILLAIRNMRGGHQEERTVFDVTKGKSFYGPDGMYGNFAGRDASRGLAKQSFDIEMLTPLDQPMDTLSDLTPAEIDNMNGWYEHFERKYIVCGELVPEGYKQD